MTPERWAEIRAEWKAALPRVLDGTDECDFVCFTANGEYTTWGRGAFAHGDSAPANRRPLSNIVERAASAANVTTKDILGSQQPRRKDVCLARHVAMYVATQIRPDLTLGQIAQYFKRDHTTVIYAREAIEQRLREGQRNIYELVSLVK